MKKATFIFPLLLSASLMGQTAALNHRASSKNHDNAKNNNSPGVNTSAASRAVIWSDDFSVPANWTINTPVGSGSNKDWVIGTAVPNGTFPITPINSTTKANGYGLFDSDKNCSGNQVADVTTANSINCSGHPFINLLFQEQYRRFSDSTFVFVSNNGTTWVKYPVNVNLIDNDFCKSNPEVVKVNISATAGNKATVWIRFEFYSPSSMGTLAGCGYSWMIDDVSLVDIPTNDVALDRAYIDFGYEDGGYYTQTPKTQVQPLSFRGVAENIGSSGQTNVKLSVTISNGTSTVYNQNSTAISSFPYLALDTLKIPSPVFTPSAQLLTYTARFKASQTQTEASTDTVNNVINEMFAVTDTVYARDNGVLGSVTSPNYYVGGEEDGSEIANLYEFPVKAQASSISVYVDTASTNGTAIQAKIYEIVSGTPTLVASSPSYSITSSSKGKWVTLPVSAILNAGGSYLASILCSNTTAGPPVIHVIVGADKSTQQPSGASLAYLSTASTPGWFNISDLPMIRLNIKPGMVGINELSQKAGIQLFQNEPNPFNRTSVIRYDLVKSTTISLEIYDLTGRKLVTMNEGTRDAGAHTVTVDGTQFSRGVYFYSLKAGDITLTKRMVITQ